MSKNYKFILAIIAILLCISVGIMVGKYIFEKSHPEIFNYNTFESGKIQYKTEYKVKENGEKYILFTIPHVDSCTEKIEYIGNKIDDNNNLNIYFDFKYTCGGCAAMDETFEIPVNAYETINEIKAYYQVVSRKSCDPDVMYKPMIYIYPTTDIDLKIKLVNDDKLTHTYPKYNNEWDVHVTKDGNILDYKTQRNYYALYWEGIDNTVININEGFVMKGEHTATFLENKLTYLGLNDKEINEFIVYWLNKMEDNNYNFIRFRTMEEINEYMPLEFSKKPDTLIRVIMDFKPLKEKINVKEQTLVKMERKGFTIVEWGGREIK